MGIFLFAYPVFGLRTPSFSQDRALNNRRDNSLLLYMSNMYDNGEIPVHRKNVVDEKRGDKLPEGQVRMRICEIRSLSSKECGYIADALGQWDKKRRNHEPEIKEIIAILRMDDEKKQSFLNPEEGESLEIYLVISDSDVNGKGKIDIEGFVMASFDRGLFIKDKAIFHINCIEISPDNLEPSARFKGVGEHLLLYTLLKGIKTCPDEIWFDIRSDVLDKKGLPDADKKTFSILEAKNYILDRLNRVLDYIKKDASQDDAYALEILSSINRMTENAI